MKHLFLAVAFIAASAFQSAEAISLRFKFKTFSSGPNIYACNAGIATPTTNKQVCYFEGTKDLCTKKDCTDGQVCNTRCVCSSVNGGDWLMNYGKAQVAPWVDNGEAPAGTWVSKTISATNGSKVFTQLHSDTDAWAKTIKELSFHLGSELYGASYFVDICYRGPQIEYFEDQVNANFSIKAQASATDFLAEGVNSGDNSRNGLDMNPTAGLKYSKLANLKVQTFAVCDTQGLGSYVYARNDQNVYNTTRNEANFVVNSSTGLPTAGGDFFRSSSASNVVANAMTFINDWISYNSSKAPRFCKIRYVFTETDIESSTPNLRKWQRHGAEMCTWTDITEALDLSSAM
ncbi:MAG: protease [Bdellovibrionia bacterium]